MNYYHASSHIMIAIAGDFSFKSNTELPADQQMLISVPEIRVRHLNQDSECFIVLVCDGIWNTLPNYCITDFIAHRIYNCDMKLSEIGEKVSFYCILLFISGRTYVTNIL